MALRTRWKNWKLRRERRKLEKEFKRVQAEAREKKDDQIYEEWRGINRWEFDVIDASIMENDSRELLDQAEKLYLPTPGPNDKDKWVPREELPPGQYWSVLTPEAMMELNAVIRKERGARREVWESWAKIIGTIVASLTGIIGTIIGLVAILKK
jgi:hypothetical protein